MCLAQPSKLTFESSQLSCELRASWVLLCGPRSLLSAPSGACSVGVPSSKAPAALRGSVGWGESSVPRIHQHHLRPLGRLRVRGGSQVLPTEDAGPWKQPALWVTRLAGPKLAAKKRERERKTALGHVACVTESVFKAPRNAGSAFGMAGTGRQITEDRSGGLLGGAQSEFVFGEEVIALKTSASDRLGAPSRGPVLGWAVGGGAAWRSWERPACLWVALPLPAQEPCGRLSASEQDSGVSWPGAEFATFQFCLPNVQLLGLAEAALGIMQKPV
ncbi:uncharacterized protein [Symphalangus syndactylus]|uniref:uncharacterized protein n=1 Tax=Symphalangus syndactylus TaxID=9590 RepID=UPI00300729B5